MKPVHKNQTSNIVMKPCPFCGGSTSCERKMLGMRPVASFIKCTVCHAKTSSAKYQEDAESKWNIRAPSRDPDYLLYEAGMKIIGVNDEKAIKVYKEAGIELIPVWVGEM